MYEERAVYDFQAQVKKTDTGWNHIKIPIGDFFNLGVDWSKVSTWFIGFEGPGMVGYPLDDVYNVVFGAAKYLRHPGSRPRGRATRLLPLTRKRRPPRWATVR